MARTKKEKMIKLDEDRAKKVQPSVLAQEEMQRSNQILSKAQMQLDEQHDDVKQMNQMVFYSKVVTVRDKQLEEAKQLEREYQEEQKKLDLMMEIQRLKALKTEEDREALRKAARKQGAQVITEQIQERHQQRLKEQELREKEREEMRLQVERLR